MRDPNVAVEFGTTRNDRHHRAVTTEGGRTSATIGFGSRRVSLTAILRGESEAMSTRLPRIVVGAPIADLARANGRSRFRSARRALLGPSPLAATRSATDTQAVEGKADMKSRTAEDERRSGIHWLIIGAFFLAAMFAMWWLVESTNTEGEHDAQLLPLFALIPLAIGLYHVVHSHFVHSGSAQTGTPAPNQLGSSHPSRSTSRSVPR
jgi:hypothetical protein